MFHRKYLTYLDELGSSLPAFLSRTDSKLNDIHVTPNTAKVITAFDSSNSSSPDRISVVILENLSLNFHE